MILTAKSEQWMAFLGCLVVFKVCSSGRAWSAEVNEYALSASIPKMIPKLFQSSKAGRKSMKNQFFLTMVEIELCVFITVFPFGINAIGQPDGYNQQNETLNRVIFFVGK